MSQTRKNLSQSLTEFVGTAIVLLLGPADGNLKVNACLWKIQQHTGENTSGELQACRPIEHVVADRKGERGQIGHTAYQPRKSPQATFHSTCLSSAPVSIFVPAAIRVFDGVLQDDGQCSDQSAF
ncbi:hypothetical protein GB937_007843 [Aspergillus fischeri]|nr:hypothetical protein GB937_007843 [Aspergillus fischeri]